MCDCTRNEHDPGDEQQQNAVQRHALLQYDDEDLCVHHHGVQEPRPHEQQTTQEVAVVAEADALAKEDTVMIPPQHTHLAVEAVGAARGSVCLAGVAVSAS